MVATAETWVLTAWTVTCSPSLLLYTGWTSSGGRAEQPGAPSSRPVGHAAAVLMPTMERDIQQHMANVPPL
ncbi:hypothetical protein DPEC_G00046250 [Dallia pectoralis]|uniref:Uncharacterized protein n=1 Tax=Dallia pectoralis TaxID=75939 RepID=A0ACC2H9V2_DALPE|nr:hypothetical protein DPEC_G00046250 [Dallia pectoralis]